MKKVLGLCFIKIKNFANSCINAKNRDLFFTRKSNVHRSFTLGSGNFLDISPEAEFQFGKNVVINQSNFITVKANAKMSIDDETYITRATISCLGEIKIGKNCILGEGMKIFDHNHQYTKDPFSVSKIDFNIGKVTMGDNVWTGANVTILKDVNIGNNVIIGAGCIVHKDVPDNSIIINKQDQKTIPANN